MGFVPFGSKRRDRQMMAGRHARRPLRPAAILIAAVLALALTAGLSQAVSSQVAASQAKASQVGLDALAIGEMQNFTVALLPEPVPAMALIGPDGAARSLADFRGRVVLLNFWATWCAPCIHEMPSLDRLQAMLGGDAFTVLAVSVDRGGLKVAQPFLQELGIQDLAVHIDPRMEGFRALGGKVMPTTVLIAADGQELGRLEGPAEWDSPEALELLRAAIAAGKPAG